MRGVRPGRRLPVAKRPLVAIALPVCLLAALTVPSHGQQQSSDARSFTTSAWRALAHGKWAEAEALAQARPADDPSALAVRARIAASRGQYKDAIKLLEPAASRAPGSEAALQLGLLHQYLGNAQLAAQLLTPILRQADSSDQLALFRAARAAVALGRLREANALFRAASAGGFDPSVETAWGMLFFQTYSNEAVKSFQAVLKEDPEWAPAHLGLAHTLADDDPPAAAKAAARALEIDPLLTEAELLLAELDLDNTKYDAARERIRRVLAANPSNLEALAMSAAIAYVLGDRAAFDAEVKHVLTINPAYGEVYRVAGDLAARNYRFDDAVAMTREAVALDPGNSKAHGQLGMHLLRTGDETEARRALDRSFRADPYDRVTFNLLALLDKLDTFVVIREGDIILKLSPEEAPVIREYAMPLAQQALKTLTAKYNFTPKGPILVEMFPVHDDFAVRTLGLPGMLGALGACFGKVVTLDSPKARPPGKFSWQATLWHEMAHVFTLQMSNQRIPRWLTEGISVYEEGQAKPEWGRDMEVPFAMALEEGKTLKLRDLNSGFTRPDTIALAYFQASLLVDHIVRTFGEAKLHALVRSYSQGLEGDAAVEKALGSKLEQLQASFDKAVDSRFGSIRVALRETPGAQARPSAVDDLATLRAAVAARPNSYTAQLALGMALAANGDRAAFEPLERAAALVPVATGDDSPHALMARLAEKLGDNPRAIREYKALLAQDHTTIEPARRLAAIAEKSSEIPSLSIAYDRVVSIDPFDAAGHAGLGRIAMKTQDAATAVREFKAALAIGPADRAAAHCDLAEAYLLAGQGAEAKKEALAALEIAPTYDRAQELLLKAIKTDPNGAGR